MLASSGFAKKDGFVLENYLSLRNVFETIHYSIEIIIFDPIKVLLVCQPVRAKISSTNI